MTLEQILNQYGDLIPQHLLQPSPETAIPFRIGVSAPKQGNFQPAKQFITAERLNALMPRSDNFWQEKAPIIARLANKYEIDNAEIFPEFIAQIAHESNELRRFEENLNYSAERLLEVFPKYFNPVLADAYAGKPAQIADRVYANRMGNRGEDSGDGWYYRGGGFIMLTGKAIYTLYGQYINKSADTAAYAVRFDFEYALDSAMWYFCIYKSLKDEAIRNDFEAITKGINGGLIGAEARKKYYVPALKIFI